MDYDTAFRPVLGPTHVFQVPSSIYVLWISTSRKEPLIFILSPYYSCDIKSTKSEVNPLIPLGTIEMYHADRQISLQSDKGF
jgi:hypothetical protein